MEINSTQWWEDYFEQGKWESNGGNSQTHFFGSMLLQNIEKEILKKINDNRFTICDFGCACGELTNLLRQSCPQTNITGMDISEAAVRKARENYGDIEFVAQDIFRSEREFDVIFCSNVLEHFQNPYEVLTKLLCLAKEYLVILVPYKEENLDPSHCYRFDERDFKGKYGNFEVIQRTVIDAAKIKNTCWNGEQLLVVMEKKNLTYSGIVESDGTFAKPEVWDKVSEDYKIEIDESEYRLADEIIRIFSASGIKAPAKIIELGCGSGHLSACLAMKGYEVTLLDFSEGALKKAQETFQYYGVQGKFIKGDIFDLSNLDEKYDLAWNSGVMEHFSGDNLEKIYKSIMKITQNRFIFLVPNPSSVSYLMMRYNLQGKRQWSYGMEYLRTNYLDIAEEMGYSGHVIGYAASSISKWHFASTFPDSENTNLYSKMVDEGLMPEDEAYLVAYELSMDENLEVVERVDKTDEKKERIFELSAINYSLEKENMTYNEIIKKYEAEIKRLQEDYEIVSDEKSNLGIENNLLRTENQSIKKENKQLFDGVAFNKEEVERLQQLNAELVRTLGPRIKSETAKVQEYISASGFSKIIWIHAFLGTFKNSGFKTKCKMLVKVLLRCVGIKKNFYIEDARMDLKIRNSVYNIENLVDTAKCAVPDVMVSSKESVVSNLPQTINEEVIMAMEPKISVLLPVYNHAEFIRSAIEGVQQQTYKNWELIIINDGSTDNLLDILPEYASDPRIRMYTQDNQRLPNTLTNLHNLATGQFVTWTSADNIMEPQMLEILSQNLLRRPEISMVYADVSIIDDKGEFLGFGYREMNRDKKNLHIMRLPHATDALDVECDNYINACFMYRMDVVRALKGQYSADLEGLEDYDFWLRLRTFGEIAHIHNSEPLYRYRVHANTMSEDLLKNKREEHQKRSERMMEYSHAKDVYSYVNWNLEFETADTELKQSLDRINYNYEKSSSKKAYVLTGEIPKGAVKNNLFVVCKKDTYEIDYLTNDGSIERRAEIYKGFDIPLFAKKVRQTSIFGLFWEYPAEFANMPVIGCHVDLNKMSIEKTVALLQANPDKLFSFCATMGGENKKVEEKILASCKNAIFMGEKELGTPVYLYASWDMAFVPPMDDIIDYELMPAILCAWSIGKWIMVEQDNLPKDILPFVSSYSCEQKMLGIKRIEQLSSVEEILDRYIAFYSKMGTAKRVLAYLNGIGQDIFVERPDFELVPKERKFPPKEIEKKYELPQNLKKGYIAIMVDTLDKGGLEQVVAMVVIEFVARGMDVQVFCTDKGGMIADDLKTEGIEVKEFDNNRKAFERYIAENPPILVNTHYAKNMLDIVKRRNIPIIEVIHNMYVFMDKEGWRAERERENKFTKMIAVSNLVKKTYEKKHGSVDADKIIVIGNCADSKKAYGANRMFVRDELGIGPSSTVFINVSSIDGRKNQLGLLTAFDMYHKTINADSYLILVGNCLSEFYDEAVTAYIKELDSREHILKLAYYRNIADLYNASDIFVMPSYFEGWSIAATEALYCGLPIIHSRCGSALELVNNGENGSIIDNPAGDIVSCDSDKLMECMGNRVPSNTDELVKAMSKMTADLDSWKGKRGKIASAALRDFSKDRMIEAYIDCFNDCLKG